MSEQVYDGGTPDSEFSTTDGVIDYGSLAGQVRLYITDTNDDPALRLFTDAQLTVFLNSKGDNVFRAAAQALRVVAASEVLVGKVIRTQAGTSTDGAKVSAELRALAAEYDGQADADDAAAVEGFFDVVGFHTDKPEGAEWRF